MDGCLEYLLTDEAEELEAAAELGRGSDGGSSSGAGFAGVSPAGQPQPEPEPEQGTEAEEEESQIQIDPVTALLRIADRRRRRPPMPPVSPAGGGAFGAPSKRTSGQHRALSQLMHSGKQRAALRRDGALAAARAVGHAQEVDAMLAVRQADCLLPGPCGLRPNQLTLAACLRLAFGGREASATLSRVFRCSRLTVANTKKTVAYAYLERQDTTITEMLDTLRRAAAAPGTCILNKVKWDETGQELTVKLGAGTPHFCHGQSGRGPWQVCIQKRALALITGPAAGCGLRALVAPIVCPPMVVANTSADTILAALDKANPLAHLDACARASLADVYIEHREAPPPDFLHSSMQTNRNRSPLPRIDPDPEGPCPTRVPRRALATRNHFRATRCTPSCRAMLLLLPYAVRPTALLRT